MQKCLHKIILAVFAICLTFFSPVGICETGIPVIQDETTINLSEDTKVQDLDIEPINTENVKKEVVPDTQNEIKKVFGLFVKTMFAVAFSAVLIFCIAIFVKKYYKSAFVPQKEDDEYDNLNLATPETKTEALKFFLNKTK